MYSDNRWDAVTAGRTSPADFSLENHGSLYLCVPKTAAVRAHLEAFTGPEAQWWCGALAVEPRYVVDLHDCLVGAGFCCGGCRRNSVDRVSC